METRGGVPRKFSFGNFTLGDGECMACSDKAACLDDQSGWGISQLICDAERTSLVEEQMGSVPDWVFEWDELSEEELESLRAEDPERAKIFDLLNSGIQD